MRHQRILICIIITILGTLLTVGIVAAAQLQTLAEAARLDDTPVGFVIDEAGIDEYFNNLSYQGLLRAESELGVVGTLYTTTNSADYGPQLQHCVDDGNDLCISVGFQLREVTQQTALNNPETYFSIVDVDYET